MDVWEESTVMRNPAEDARGLSFGRAEEPGGMPFIVFALDAEGVFTASDGKGLAALDLEPGEVVGRSAFEVYRAASGELACFVSVIEDITGRKLAGLVPEPLTDREPEGLEFSARSPANGPPAG